MRLHRYAGVLALAMLPGISLGAAETALHLVNTSVGVVPNGTARNKFKLQTDPQVITGPASAPDPTVSQYIPVEGMLNNHYDTTQFNLSTNLSTGTFTLGDSVAGLGAYQVVGFKVQTVEGGLIDVEDNGLGGDSYTEDTDGVAPNGDPLGAVGGGYTGNVFDIHFKLIDDRKSMALSADQDQLFYQLFLDQIGNDPPGLDSTFSTPDSFITVAPSDLGSTLQPYTIPGFLINNSYTPEVSSMSLLAFTGIGMLTRRRKASTEAPVGAA